jgi:hypothetical protein
MSDEIINRVAQSGLITIDLEKFYTPGERIVLDIAPQLFQGLILREKDFREFVKNENWEKYKGKFVSIVCSADAIVPTWAYMLIALHLEPFATRFVYGNSETLETILFEEKLSALDLNSFRDARIVIKGCGELSVPTQAYIKLSGLLKPIAKSIAYGEPCSTVPLFKKK